MVGCHLLIGVSARPHGHIRSCAHTAMPVCQGECKTIETIKIHTQSWVDTGKKKTNSSCVGTDSLSLCPNKRPLVDRNRERDFLMGNCLNIVCLLKSLSQTAKMQVRMNFDGLVGPPCQPFQQIPKWGNPAETCLRTTTHANFLGAIS